MIFSESRLSTFPDHALAITFEWYRGGLKIGLIAGIVSQAKTQPLVYVHAAGAAGWLGPD
jgi:hypothetical protein